MTTRAHLYNGLAALVWYPGAEYLTNARRCRALIATRTLADSSVDGIRYEEVLGHCDAFLAATGAMDVAELEELFTRTFDINPVCSLELGWHLYGETYQRGSFLVSMRETLRALEIPESTELPDHLSHALSAVGRMDEGEARAFVNQYLLPALRKMLEGFASSTNPFEHVLRAVYGLASVQFAPIEGAMHNV